MRVDDFGDRLPRDIPFPEEVGNRGVDSFFDGGIDQKMSFRPFYEQHAGPEIRTVPRVFDVVNPDHIGSFRRGLAAASG